MLFYIIIAIVIIQRIVELVIAKRNEKWMRSQGAFEAGAEHYPIMVAMHIAFFISLLIEVLVLDRPLSPLWIPLLSIFLIAQVARVWCLASLGKFWNTKIIILPGADVVKKGPYQFIRHPNYVIVATELLVLPLIFNAYFTAIVFSILNIWMLSVRIPTEEKALKEVTNYKEKFGLKSGRSDV
ncbi:isoprenylcysteine carboxyl methyltransferase [Sporosarcina sp. Marseille-Q4063]|uniref:isoprenylcysteine carboxyl methyltransferase family protein n=1 Tax=Sporosarcina sp. Marseille-Q4063 TaxID=2810514 RepID=UPI001BB05B8F|nr:isoprenylcysteine carboxylmethyltransferase family protein [Sporosarcina sp. Marseille-Q4063]QUW23181.1 isoprenylcysteine carboxyl methyltransferase [Sporosarcina sp. Marseille-Q4063]